MLDGGDLASVTAQMGGWMALGGAGEDCNIVIRFICVFMVKASFILSIHVTEFFTFHLRGL